MAFALFLGAIGFAVSYDNRQRYEQYVFTEYSATKLSYEAVFDDCFCILTKEALVCEGLDESRYVYRLKPTYTYTLKKQK